MADIVDKGLANQNINYIIKIGGFMLLIAAGGTLCSIMAANLSSRTAEGFGRILRKKNFAKVESFSLNEFDKLGSATLITRTTNDVTQIQQASILILSMMVTAPLTCIGGVIMALKQDTSLTWVLVVAVPILLCIIGITFIKGMPLFKVMQKKIDKLNLVLRENLTGIDIDPRTEVYIQRAMSELMQNRTSFVIAHRLSTIKDAELILVMNKGSIIEMGNHNELLAQNGFYADLYNSQFTGANLDNEAI